MRTLLDLGQSILKRIDPERAHTLAIQGLEITSPFLTQSSSDPCLSVNAFGLSFPNPLGVAAGFDKNGQVPDAMLRLGFGFAEVGTVTPKPQVGNPKPRLFRLPADEAVINRFGFNGEGAATVLKRLEERAHRQGIVGVNIGANKDSKDRIADYVSGITTFAPVASYFAVNVSSPNTPGLRDLQYGAEFDKLVAHVLDARDQQIARTGRKPVLFKISPDLTLAELDDIVRIARTRRVDGLIVSNTTVSRPSTLESGKVTHEIGGLSGKPLFDHSTWMLAETFLRVEKQFPLIGVGGVSSAETAIAKIEAGATLIQLYSALTYTGINLVNEIKRGLSEYLWINSQPSHEILIGRTAHKWQGRFAK